VRFYMFAYIYIYILYKERTLYSQLIFFISKNIADDDDVGKVV